MPAVSPVPDRSSVGDGNALGAAVSIAVAVVAAIVTFTIVAGITGSPVAAAPMAAVAAAAVAMLLRKRPIFAYDPAAASRPLQALAAVVTVASLVQLARLAVFIVSPAQVGWSQFPSSGWELRHSCLTAYFVAGQAITTTPNIYDDALFSLPGDPTAIRKPRMLGPFGIDAYEYPPPFLLLPRALGLVASDFARLRMVWFGLSVGTLLLAMLVVARALGPTAGTRALLLVPLVWAGIPTLNTLQKGNVQLLEIAACMCAMVLFERRRWAAGGCLLAFGTVSKIYPGMLIVYLLARRQWRAVAWTAACSGAVVLLSLLDTGFAPFAAFLHHLPGILGGEAFPAFRNPGAMAINLSVPGIVFKLKLFGIAGTTFATAKLVGWLYTLVVLGAIALVARRSLRDGEAPAVWLAILILATLRSPFLPQGYGSFPAIWLLTLLAARGAATPKSLLLLTLTWLAFNLYVPMDWGLPPRWLAVLNAVPQVATAGVAVIALRRSGQATATAAETATAAA